MAGSKNLSIIPLTKNESAAITNLHRAGIQKGFLSTLNNNFLKSLYYTISTTSGSIVFVVKDLNNYKTIGFIAGSTDTRRMYFSILLRHGWKFILHLLPYAFKVSTLKNILETLFYPLCHKRVNDKNSSSIGKCNAELLSISIDDKYRHNGIGKRLIVALERFFEDQNVTEYHVVTSANDKNSNAFYMSCGFSFSETFYHHGNMMNRYIKSINQQNLKNSN